MGPAAQVERLTLKDDGQEEERQSRKVIVTLGARG